MRGASRFGSEQSWEVQPDARSSRERVALRTQFKATDPDAVQPRDGVPEKQCAYSSSLGQHKKSNGPSHSPDLSFLDCIMV